jgi:hypothetical protein
VVFVPLAQRLASNQVPLILAGPLLRHVAHNEVTVFVALREARTVTLRVFAGTGGGRTTRMQGNRATVPLGDALHVVAVTARAASASVRLVPETTYYYNLDLGGGQTLASAGVLNLAATTDPLAYPGADLPSFSLPPARLDQVRLVHASCRKPHGDSVDALTALDDMIAGSGADASTPAFALARPHQLFLTGDQIYADDVSDVLLFMLADATTALLGWDEPLPGTTTAGLAPGARSPVTIEAGLTSGIPKAEYPKSHLLRFGEYAAMYLFAWSPAPWPADLPATGAIGSPTLGTTLAAETAKIESFRTTLPAVRKALANIPSYMIFDDHEITDDWFMNRRWVGPVTTRRPTGGVLVKPLGRRVLQNGLLAYALFQAWGNTPGQFAATGAPGTAGRALLTAAAAWRGPADASHAEIATRVGMPSAVPPGSSVDTTLVRPAGALTWNYRVAPDGGRYEVLVLDGRTVRGYPAGGDTVPPALLRPGAIIEQVTGAPDDQALQVTFVVAQTPVLGLPFVEDKQREATGDLIWDRDVEAWSLNEDAYQRLLGALVLRRRRTVVLSGDVHYTFAARMTYWATRPYEQSVQAAPVAAAVVQLNSSALKNQTSEPAFANTLRLHIGGYNQFYVQNIGTTMERAGWRLSQTGNLQVSGSTQQFPASRRPPGWARNPAVIDPAALPSGSHVTVQPEWRYRITFLPGTKPAGPAAPLPTLTVVPTGTTAAANAIRDVQNAYQTMRRDDTGRDIVGRNNIGELRVQTDAGGTPTQIVQQTWWRFQDNATPVPTTTYTVSLDPATPAAPAPLP